MTGIIIIAVALFIGAKNADKVNEMISKIGL
jgi:hypothetical protein